MSNGWKPLCSTRRVRHLQRLQLQRLSHACFLVVRHFFITYTTCKAGRKQKWKLAWDICPLANMTKKSVQSLNEQRKYWNVRHVSLCNPTTIGNKSNEQTLQTIFILAWHFWVLDWHGKCVPEAFHFPKKKCSVVRHIITRLLFYQSEKLKALNGFVGR